MWNRSAMFEILTREIERSKRESTLSVIMADLDHFNSSKSMTLWVIRPVMQCYVKPGAEWSPRSVLMTPLAATGEKNS